MKIPITPVILAAGDSRRMGFPKALLPLGKETFLSRILTTLNALELETPIAVLGRHAALIEQRLAQSDVRIVINPNPEEGQISSVRLAVSTLGSSILGCLIWPADHPLIPSGLVEQLVRLFLKSEAAIALPIYGDKMGHPAIFSRQLFTEILHSPAEEGLKTVIRRHQDVLLTLPTSEPSTVEDIDTPDDFKRITGLSVEDALNPRSSG